MNTKCQHEHSAPIELIKSLPVTQAGVARHKCAVCAYEQGLLDGFKLALENLSISDEDIIKLNELRLKKEASKALDIALSIKSKMEKK